MIFGALVGQPKGDQWTRAMDEFVEILDATQNEGLEEHLFDVEFGRRGDFYAMQSGISMGMGRQVSC